MRDVCGSPDAASHKMATERRRIKRNTVNNHCTRCGKWNGAHATLPGQPRDHLCHCQQPALAAMRSMPQGEPVAWVFEWAEYGPTDIRGQQWAPALSFSMPWDGDGKRRNIRPLYATPQPAAKPVQAPGYCKHCKQYTIEEPLPAQPLTDEQIFAIEQHGEFWVNGTPLQFARAIEAAHGIKPAQEPTE